MSDFMQFKPVKVKFTPRPEFEGMAIHPDVVQYIGQEVTVVPMFMMDDDDKYPGEWALTNEENKGIFGRLWIASGDVTILEEPS